ncbi:SH3 domain-containing protein [Ceratocystis platani]|uniref:SH3 domain-containing protein n=1 Tax=Ceratocystis fimbriata f. sp. platani TaxID=88771 RepID=A0A0F8CX79_CERFI|nr:SH3 domain-containing protein [Ceratocystis platani]
MTDSHASKAAEAGVPYYPPPPPGPPAQPHDQTQAPAESSYPPIPVYVPAEAAKQEALQSHPPYSSDSKAEHSAQVPAYSTTGPATFSHPNDKPLPDSQVPPVTPIAHTDSEEAAAAKGSAFSKWGKKLQQYGEKAALPINNLTNKMGMQSFLPMAMDRECDKAADIITSFTKDGVEVDKPVTSPGGKPTKEKSKSMIKIPPKVIANAVGIVVFTAVRAGFQIAGTTGSGVLVARLADGSWSPPSGVQVASLGGGFLMGVEVYDCVLVINNPAALAAFLRTRVSLGPEVAVAAGPYGVGGGAHVGAGAGSRGEKGSEHLNTSAKHAAEESPNLAGTTQVPPVDIPATGTTATPSGAATLKPADKKHKRTSSGALKPVFSYVKSKGFYAGAQVDGTVIVERKEANAAFYGGPIGVERIIRGEVEVKAGTSATVQKLTWPTGGLRLLEALNKADVGAVAARTTEATPAPAPVARESPPPPFQDTGAAYPKDEKVPYN